MADSSCCRAAAVGQRSRRVWVPGCAWASARAGAGGC